MTTATFFPYDTGPHDTDGHSFAAFWTAVIGFTVLSALIATAGFQWAAVNHFF